MSLHLNTNNFNEKSEHMIKTQYLKNFSIKNLFLYNN
jgi:hypothetical protein